jgi:hypothetical protein
MNLNTLKRYAKASCNAIVKSADCDDLDSFTVGKRLAGNIRAMQKIYAKEPYNSLSSQKNIFRKWGKL